MKFEEHEGQLFRMLDKPVPLTPDAEMPCVVRLIQDDSPMGRHNRDAVYSDVIGKLFVAQKIKENSLYRNTLHAYEKNSLNQDYCIASIHTLEIIGYPVVEGSREWALWKMLNGEMVHRSGFPYKALNGEIYCTNSAGEIYPATSYQLWLENKAKDGWKIYEEPEPQYKVGDWVDCKDHAGVHAQCKVLEIHKHNVILGCKTGHRWSLPHNNIIRKLSPSEVIVHIGCLSGTVRRINDIYFALNPSSKAGLVVPEASIPHAMLDTNTRSLVESLLEAQEEK